MKEHHLECPKCLWSGMAPVVDNANDHELVEDLEKADLVGDYTYCPHCWTICTFEERGNLHVTTEEEFENMSQECREGIEQEIEIRKVAGKLGGVTQCVGRCPDCDRPLISVVVGGRPGKARAGDIGMCAHCGSWLTVGDDTKLRWATEEEVSTVPQKIKDLLNQARDQVMRRY